MANEQIAAHFWMTKKFFYTQYWSIEQKNI